MRSRLSAVLADRKVNKSELARRLDVSPCTVSAWCRDDGVGRMSVRTLCAIARAVGCDPRELFEP